MNYFLWISILFLAGLANLAYGVAELKEFLKYHSSISSTMDMGHFKKMVRKQMYLALAQIVILGCMALLSIIGILTGAISDTQFLLVLLMDGIIWFAGKLFKSLEKRAQNLKVEALEHRAEYTSICATWVRKPFPDF
ncbi:MAG: hypothetical protein GF388_07740 [Candidatus Aegiribacteria sp.]|nr:hypothetical protein [Candidatus Aegiribacteria sp.]MBD3295010.1 hypothetical protein [Candidatus Fermentibacteria bacterium]